LKIVAFLQNPWFKPGTPRRLIARYRDDPVFRRRVLGAARTGLLLRRMLGEALFESICWENANPRHGTDRLAAFPAEVRHMRRVIHRHAPEVVVLFGRQAQDGFDRIRTPGSFVVLRAPHPQARGSYKRHLAEVSAALREIVSKEAL